VPVLPAGLSLTHEQAHALPLKAPDKPGPGLGRWGGETGRGGRAGHVEYSTEDRSREAASKPALRRQSRRLEYMDGIAGFGGPVNPRAVMWGALALHAWRGCFGVRLQSLESSGDSTGRGHRRVELAIVVTGRPRAPLRRNKSDT